MMPMDAPATLNHEGIAQRVPHQGSMCLLDRVTAWDSTHIRCEAISHQSTLNPLRAFGRLGASCGIEYAAQAMAVHGALVSEAHASWHSPSTGPQVGYLASVRSVTLHVDRLDDLNAVLNIHAERVSGDVNSILYTFSVSAGPALLLCGRAAVVLNAATLPQPRPNTTQSAAALSIGTSGSL